MKTTNAKSRQFVQSLQEFKASNLSARKEGQFYVVYSYGWYPLFAYSYENDRWFENVDKYSVSTSRQRSQAHPQPLKKSMEVSHETMKDLLNGVKL